jgi:hypothetical protein
MVEKLRYRSTAKECPMARMLLTLATLATTCGIATGITASRVDTPSREVQIVGQEQPLNLGGVVVTASALPAEG